MRSIDALLEWLCAARFLPINAIAFSLNPRHDKIHERNRTTPKAIFKNDAEKTG